jgi:hypothetical protein
VRGGRVTLAAAAQSSASRLPEQASSSSHRIPACRDAAVHLLAGPPIQCGMSAIRSPAVRSPAHDDREKHARHRKADLIVIMARPSRILVSSDSRVSIGGLVERWYYVIEGWSNPRAWTILDARGRSPMCDRVASPLLGRGAGGAPPATSSRLSGPTEVSAEWTSRVRIWHL